MKRFPTTDLKCRLPWTCNVYICATFTSCLGTVFVGMVIRPKARTTSPWSLTPFSSDSFFILTRHSSYTTTPHALRQCLHRDRSGTMFPINTRYDKTSLPFVPVYIQNTCRRTKGRPQCNCSIRRGGWRGTGKCIILYTTTGRAFIVIADICVVYICVRRMLYVVIGEFPRVHWGARRSEHKSSPPL